MREKRQNAIRKIIEQHAVGTQRELLDRLDKKGLPADQSTLSRDLAEIGVRKVNGRYALSAASDAPAADRQPDLSPVVNGFVPCGPHLVVVRTTVGQAQPVSLAIDAAGDPAIVATLAGDDTVFVATRNSKTQAVTLRRLEKWFGDKRER